MLFRTGNLSSHADKSIAWRAGYIAGINSNPVAENPDADYLEGYCVGVSDIKHFV